jgi:plastocyanin
MIKFVTFGLAAMAAVALVACGGGGSTSTPSTSSQAATTPAGAGGGGGSSSGGGASTTVKLAADSSDIAYDTDSLSAKAGNVTIDFNNPNKAIGHDVCVQVSGGSPQCSKVVTGSSSTLDLSNLKPGSYTFYCSVDSHEQAGMKGTLTVQ